MNIFESMRAAADPEKAVQMKAYMKGHFSFLGIQRPERNRIQQPYLALRKSEKYLDSEFVRKCWMQPEREFQHLAMDYVKAKIRYTDAGHMGLFHFMLVTKSWWDTVDLIAANLVGPLATRFPEIREQYISRWISDDNMWLRRTSLLFQLKYREQTDTLFLQHAIEANLGSREFFINKAIGWALRQYSKTDAGWVREFIETHDLAPLSAREGRKYL